MSSPMDVDLSDVQPLHMDLSDVQPMNMDLSDVQPMNMDLSDVQPLHMDLSGMQKLGEKMKIVYQFVARAEPHKVDDVLNECKDQPTSLFNLVKLLLADKFHRFDLMVELLYGGDTAIMNGILSKRWMYEGETNSLIDSQFLLDELFPKVSYICRMKVLHKIGRYARNEVIVDKLWHAVERMYGFNAAFPLLEACSKDVITSVIDNRKVKLSGYQVVTLLQKYPKIGLKYFKENSVQCSKMNPQCSPIHYLYEHRMEDFIDLYINHPHKLEGFKIGRYRTTKMIRSYRAKLLEHPNRTTALLNLDRIQREFSHQDFHKLFESTLPRTVCNVGQYWKWVCKVPRRIQVDMVNAAYMNLYNIDLLKHPNYMNEEYIFLLPEMQRLEIVESKIANLKGNPTSMTWSYKGLRETVNETDLALPYFFLPLKPINYSAPELKVVLIVENNVSLQATLTKYLIETCYLNDALPQLLDALTFFRDQFTIYQPEVHRVIFRTVNQISKMELSEKHWDVIIEMVQKVIAAKGDMLECELEEIVQKCIAFRLNSELPLDNSLVHMHIKLKIGKYDAVPTFDNKYIKRPEHEQSLLGLYAEELEWLDLSKNLCDFNGNRRDEILKNFVVGLIDKMWRFSCDNKGNNFEPIPFVPWFISTFEEIAQDEEQKLDQHCKVPVTSLSKQGRGFVFWGIPNKFLKYIQWLRDEHKQTIDAFHGSDYYFSKMWLCLPNHQTIRHFLKTNPSHLLPNWTVNISKMLEVKACVALMRTLKTWNYSTLVNQTISDCTEIVHAAHEVNKVKITRKGNALLVLSILMETSEFLALVTEFYPTDKEVDVAAEKAAEDYGMREAITRSLINISTPHLAFDALKKFTVGDYLKLVINSLYSQILRAESTKSLDFLRPQLTNVPVSLHKHIIRLYCTITSVDDKSQVLQDVQSANVSIRYVYFLQIDKLFRSDPTHETWSMMINAIESTTVEDASILEFLHATPELDTVPLEYISNYTDACLTVLRQLQPSAVDAFITHVSKNIKNMPADLLERILMHDSEKAESFHAEFLAAYLKNSKSKAVLKYRLTNVCRVLCGVIKRGWDRQSQGQRYPTRSLVLGFIENLTYAIDDSSKVWVERPIFQSLLALFKTFQMGRFSVETITLHLASLNAEVFQFDIASRFTKFAQMFAKLVDSLVNSYGREIIMMEIDRIEKYIKWITRTYNNKNVMVQLVDEIFKTSKSRSNQIIAINLLNDVDIPHEVHLLEMLVKIDQLFAKSDDVVIQTYYASAHRKHTLKLKPPLSIPNVQQNSVTQKKRKKKKSHFPIELLKPF